MFLAASAVARDEPAKATDAAKTESPATDRLPFCGLAPSKLQPNLCLLKYRISTMSPECQAFFDQGLGYFYSYVWMEAARSFETAAKYDPECPMAWWGLSRALDQWKKSNHNQALEKAQQLLGRASHREQFLINARLQEKGLAPGITPDQRRKAAAKTLDEMLTLYEDDEEGWYARAQISEGGVSAVPYYKALLRINPLHPGANHELVHFYENYFRPALGWPYAEKYIESSPGIPHAFHMQAHLATRLGRWDKTSDRSARAIELERAYHKEMKVDPKDDFQFSHHLETLTRSLVHDGRFREARAIKDEVWAYGMRHWELWFRLYLAERDYDAALQLVEDYRKDKQGKSDKLTWSYWKALIYLKQGDVVGATAEVEVLQEAFQTRKNDRVLEARLWETQGLLMCLTDSSDAGPKLLAKAVERTKNDYSHHAWGNGAYYMEAWGIGALTAGKDQIAEEAFLEALAHDPGSVRGALGLQVLCERQGRLEEAARYAELARRSWRRAEVQHLEAELTEMRRCDHNAEVRRNHEDKNRNTDHSTETSR
jgi:Tfp pilus assembly protein PilF